MSERKYRIDHPEILPTSPAEQDAYRRLYKLSELAAFSADGILPIMTEHTGIADRLLRVVNSMRHPTPRRISDLRHAIVMLGANGMREFSEPVVQSIDARNDHSTQATSPAEDATASFGRTANDGRPRDDISAS